jgi:hypothetical protein
MADADNPDCRIPGQGPDHDTVAVQRSDDNHNSGAAPMSRTLSRPRIGTLVATAVLSLTGALAAQDVTYDFDKSADFSALHSYVWVQGTSVADELNHKRIVAAIDQQLAAKGLGKADGKANADAYVAYHAAFSRDLEINASGWGGYRFGPARSGSARVEQVVVGTLVVDIIDAKTGSILWRGIASKELDPQASPEKRDKNINKAAEKLFKKYPPQA